MVGHHLWRSVLSMIFSFYKLKIILKTLLHDVWPLNCGLFCNIIITKINAIDDLFVQYIEAKSNLRSVKYTNVTYALKFHNNYSYYPSSCVGTFKFYVVSGKISSGWVK